MNEEKKENITKLSERIIIMRYIFTTGAQNEKSFMFMLLIYSAAHITQSWNKLMSEHYYS